RPGSGRESRLLARLCLDVPADRSPLLRDHPGIARGVRAVWPASGVAASARLAGAPVAALAAAPRSRGASDHPARVTDTGDGRIFYVLHRRGRPAGGRALGERSLDAHL